jgi:SAM-dependent methyltransferase
MMNPTEYAPRYVREPTPSFEAREHEKRGGAPYSFGHRQMYRAPIELLKGQPDLDILEIGTGIGYGLEQMMNAGFVARYYGVEPDADAFALAQSISQQFSQQDLTLWNRDWLRLTRETPGSVPICDYAFCIEVIEHIAATDVPEFLREIRQRTRRGLFLSTPDAVTSLHGVATRDEWKKALHAAGFEVAACSRQWTTLFICEPN